LKKIVVGSKVRVPSKIWKGSFDKEYYTGVVTTVMPDDRYKIKLNAYPDDSYTIKRKDLQLTS